jgi:hypothetical protein
MDFLTGKANHINNGIDAWKTTIKTIKDKYPKP